MLILSIKNRDEFNRAHTLIHNWNIRQHSAGDLRVAHVAMTFSFADTAHGERAAARLNECGMRTFEITQNP